MSDTKIITNPCCCGNCPADCSGCQATINVTVSGLTGPCAAINGYSIPCTRTGCEWYGSLVVGGDSPPTGTINAYIHCVSNHWIVTVETRSFFYSDTSWVDGTWTGILSIGLCPHIGMADSVHCVTVHLCQSHDSGTIADCTGSPAITTSL